MLGRGLDTRRRILIVTVNWLGDLIFLTPAIRALRKAYPESFLACMVPLRGADLLTGNPHLDLLIPFQEPRGILRFFTFFKLIRSLRAQRFDTVFLFHRSFTRTLLTWLAGIPHRVGYRTLKRGWLLTQAVDPPLKDSVHKADYFLKLLQGAGIEPDGDHYEVGLLEEDRQVIQALLKEWGITPEDRLVAIHPGANWRLKRWPLRDFALLADHLATRFHVKVLFLGSAEDAPLIRQIRAVMRTDPLVATGKTNFRQLGALLSRTKLLVSNDSGPLHLGLAVGIPVVALFGPTDPKLTGPPIGFKAITLFGSVGCPVPCYQLRCPVNLCMSQIRVEQVVEAAAQFLSP